jgi:hypothetical protein
MQRGASALRRALALNTSVVPRNEALGAAMAAAGTAAASGAAPGPVRAFSSPPPGPSVAPAITSVDIASEWYNRQRQSIPLGNRVPDTAVGAYIAPSATIVGDVDLLERVRPGQAAWGGGAGAQCGALMGGLVGSVARTRVPLDAAPFVESQVVPCCPLKATPTAAAPPRMHLLSLPVQASVWNHVVLRGDLNNITVGQVSNIQDRTVVHAARCGWTVCGRPALQRRQAGQHCSSAGHQQRSTQAAACAPRGVGACWDACPSDASGVPFVRVIRNTPLSACRATALHTLLAQPPLYSSTCPPFDPPALQDFAHRADGCGADREVCDGGAQLHTALVPHRRQLHCRRAQRADGGQHDGSVLSPGARQRAAPGAPCARGRAVGRQPSALCAKAE